MTSHRELELKLAIASRFAERIERFIDSPEGQRKLLTSLYYDTPKFALRRAGLSLRIRSDGSSFVQTVKSAGAGADRNELEVPVPDARPDFNALNELTSKLSKKRRRRLRPVFATMIVRQAYPLEGKNIELALHRDEIKADGSQLPVGWGLFRLGLRPTVLIAYKPEHQMKAWDCRHTTSWSACT